MVTIIKDAEMKDAELTIVAKSVKPDSKKRVILPKSLVREGITYHICLNQRGQIILDPQVTIPESELWLFENKELLALVDRGMLEEQTINRGSFAKYVKDVP